MLSSPHEYLLMCLFSSPRQPKESRETPSKMKTKANKIKPKELIMTIWLSL